jgi:hypothetical protein
MASNDTLNGDWLSCGATMSATGLTRAKILRAAERGEIRTLRERGQPTRFSRRDALALSGILAKD